MFSKINSEFILFVLVPHLSFAAGTAGATGSNICETIQTSQAKSCNDLKVVLDLRKCAVQGKPALISMKVNCETSPAFAETQTRKYLYKTWVRKKTKKVGWNITAVWSASGKFNRTPKNEHVTETTVKPPAQEEPKKPDRAPAAIRPNESVAPKDPSANLEPVVKINGFIDAQYQGNSNFQLSRGFLINDGALYITSNLQDIDFKIDIPFSMYNASNANFTIGTARAQAYLGQKFSNGLRWKAGQFDTTYGFEGNDTTDITFSRQGSLYTFTDPFVHTGVLFGYDFNSELGLNIYLTDPNDRGIVTKGKGLQYGLQLVKVSPSFRFAPGFLVNPDPITQNTNFYLDLTAGVTLGSLSIDGELSYNYRSDIINPETNKEMKGLGTLLQTLYNFDENTSFGFRAEYVTNQSLSDPKGSSTQSALKSQSLLFVGPQHYINKSIRIKLDYSYQIDTPYFSDSTIYSHGIQVSSVFRF